MAETKIFMLSFVLSILTCIFMVIGFSSPYWVEQEAPSSSSVFQRSPQVSNIGLWEMCFNNARLPRSHLDRDLNGCWYVFAKEYDPVRSQLMPGWFVSVQVMASLSLVLICVSVLCLSLYYFRMCAGEYPTLIASCCLMFTSGLITTVSAIIFGANVGNETWMPDSRLIELSWAFAFYIIAAFFALFSGMGIIVSAIQYRTKYVT